MGSEEVGPIKPLGPVYVVLRGDVSGLRPGDKSSAVSPFFGITTNQDDALRATHGISGAVLRRFESYHTAPLGLFRALFPKHSQSYQWKTQRQCGPPRIFSSSGPDALLDSSTFLPPPRISQGPLRRRAAPPPPMLVVGRPAG